MSPFLRGAGNTSSPNISDLKDITDFKQEHRNAPKSDQADFVNAHEAQTMEPTDFKLAKELYNELLEKYPKSKTLLHNLDLIDI